MSQINITLSRDRLELLNELYSAAASTFEPINAHEELLHDHVKELAHLLGKKTYEYQKSYRICFSSPEARAFIQFWALKPYQLPTSTATILQNLIAKVDQESK